MHQLTVVKDFMRPIQRTHIFQFVSFRANRINDGEYQILILPDTAILRTAGGRAGHYCSHHFVGVRSCCFCSDPCCSVPLIESLKLHEEILQYNRLVDECNGSIAVQGNH